MSIPLSPCDLHNICSSGQQWQNRIMKDQNHNVYIALGSNLGESARLIMDAMDVIESSGRRPLERSTLWRSAPLDCPPGSPDFVNAVVGFRPSSAETPRRLLQYLQQLEVEFGRTRGRLVNAPRRIDLDIICFAEQMVNEADLVIPHPRAIERLFVLAPLAELAPELRFPGTHSSVGELIARLAGQQVCRMDL